MRMWITTMLVASAFAVGVAPARAADKPLAGMSWFKFADERWKIDETGIKKGLAEAGGADYISADANFSVEKQASDIEGLLTRGAKVLIITSGDAGAMVPIVTNALKAGVPVIAYDQLIDVPGVFYVSFDAKSVGYALADGMLKVAPKGNYALIKGDDKDPNTIMMLEGFMQKMKPFIDSGAIKIVGEQFVDGWKPEPAKAAMEQILTATNNKVDAVMVMNDGMASGVAEALAEQGLNIPISGQDGAPGALNRIARGQQTFTIWKNSLDEGDAAGRVALALINKRPVEGKITFATAKGNKLDAILLPVERIDRTSLDKPVGVGWSTKAIICAGVTKDAPPLCQ
jgi:D-xylose transport system substrate-binding protein